MNWKTVVALAVLVILGFIMWNMYTRQKWIEKDVEAQIQIAKLLEVAETNANKADKHKEASLIAEADARLAAAQRKRAEDELTALRKKYRNRPVATNLGACQSQLQDCDALILKLDTSLKLADETVFALNDALVAERAASEALMLRASACCEAQEMERDRVETWQQQTKRGRVKTAFLVIGTAAASGAAGYGIGRATQ